MRRLSWLLFLCGCGSCSQGSGSFATDDFDELVMEQGGACPGTDPCWWRTRVARSAIIALERPTASMTANLAPSEFDSVLGIVNRNSFRTAINSPTPLCPPAFDSDYDFTLVTSSGTARDKFGAGCVLDEEDIPSHPYRDLFRLLDTLRRKYFPGVLPF